MNKTLQEVTEQLKSMLDGEYGSLDDQYAQVELKSVLQKLYTLCDSVEDSEETKDSNKIIKRIVYPTVTFHKESFGHSLSLDGVKFDVSKYTMEADGAARHLEMRILVKPKVEFVT